MLNRPGRPPVRSLYIHIPFCFHKCHYCDFYSFVDTRDRQGPFASRLARELEAIAPLAAGAPLRTIFVGGGTPTLLASEHWRVILRALDERFDLSEIRSGEGEWTVECNPETATAELLDTLVEAGVNRLSVGAQSFEPRHLKTLERWHDPESVPRALGLAREAGISRLSVDLIHAIPGQTLDEWRADLLRAIDLGVEHISAYTLTYEPNTAMTARLRMGDFQRADEDLEADMFELTNHVLNDAGFSRYEVSNHARAGAECRHNLAYWRGEDWLAAGPSASGHIAGMRYKVAPRLGDYLGADLDGYAPVTDVELPDPRRSLADRLLSGLRLREGVVVSDVMAGAFAIAQAIPAALEAVIAGWISTGHAERIGDRWVLTDRGVLVADRIAADAIGALEA